MLDALNQKKLYKLISILKEATVVVLQTPFRLQRVGADASIHHSVTEKK